MASTPPKAGNRLEIAKLVIAAATPLTVALLSVTFTRQQSQEAMQREEMVKREAAAREAAQAAEARRAAAADKAEADQRQRIADDQAFARERMLRAEAFAREVELKRASDAREDRLAAQARDASRSQALIGKRFECWEKLGEALRMLLMTSSLEPPTYGEADKKRNLKLDVDAMDQIRITYQPFMSRGFLAVLDRVLADLHRRETVGDVPTNAQVQAMREQLGQAVSADLVGG